MDLKNPQVYKNRFRFSIPCTKVDHLLYSFAAVCLGLFFSTAASGWGERGHDLVTRVAVQLVDHDRNATGKFSKPLLLRAASLGHLANIPDNLWRSDLVSKTIRDENAPTHYIHMDDLGKPVVLKNTPTTWTAAAKVAKQNGKDLATQVGSAPWRIKQLAAAMRRALENCPAGADNQARRPCTDEAILYGGLLSHFVGDLANPEHSSANYDGWDSGQGGLHAYFEAVVVDSLPLNFEYEVLEHARRRPAYKSRITDALRAAQLDPQDSLHVAWALAVDSYGRLGELERLDRQHAVLKTGSQQQGVRVPAQRRPPAAVRAAFKPLLTERLALAAETLAALWIAAWVAAGSPDLSGYQSFGYPVTPDLLRPEFIRPDYLQP